MRLKLDENLPRSARPILESGGFKVHDVHDEELAGAHDRDIQAACEHESRILVTLDTDFADTRRYDPGRSPGVVVLRPSSMTVQGITACLETTIRALKTHSVTNALWIVEPGRLRVRDFSARG